MSDKLELAKKKLAIGFVLVFLLGVIVGLLLCGILPISGSPEGTGDLTVYVEDANGDSINHAQVSLDGGSSQPVTGGDASRTFDNVPYGQHEVSASAAGYQSNTTQVIVDEQNEEVTIVLGASEDPSDSGESEPLTEKIKFL
jgi:hypothetical protein